MPQDFDPLKENENKNQNPKGKIPEPDEVILDMDSPSPETSPRLDDSGEGVSLQEKSLEVSQDIPLSDAHIMDDIIKSSQIPEETPDNSNTVSVSPVDDDDLLGTIMEENNQEIAPEEENINKIHDINLDSLENVSRTLVQDNYDFITFTPNETDVLVSFRREKKEMLSKHILYPAYTTILAEFKKTLGIPAETLTSEAESKGDFILDEKNYEILGKVVPGGNGEKIFLKLKEKAEKKDTRQKKKASLGSIISFLVATIFVALIMGGAFLTFVVLNAQTVEDVQFFYSLGISLNDINTFISRLVTIIFSVLLFIETAVLAIFLFKFALTKKIFKRKKVLYGMIATAVIIGTFVTGSTWMIIDRKIKSLPNWQELAYGDIQIFDNDRLSSDEFEKSDALLTSTSDLIGPVTLKYDLSLFAKNEEKSGFKIRKYIWNFGGEVVEEFTPTIIKTFDTKGNYEVTLRVEGSDTTGKALEKVVDNLPVVIVGYTVDVTEETTNNGGKIFGFDASDLKDLGTIEWYMVNASGELEKVWEGLTFKPSKIFFEQTLVGLYINNIQKKSETLDKLFVLGAQGSGEIDGKIISTQSIKNELEYELSISNPETSFGDGFINEFEWQIGERKIIKKADPANLESSSKINFTFTSYGENPVSVLLKDDSGKVKEISTVINIQKNMTLKSPVRIYDGQEELTGVRYDSKNHEYYLDALGIPTILKLDARLVRPENLTYSLQEVSWNLDNDNSIDGTGKTIEYEVPTEGNHTVAVTYTFVHRKVATDIIKLTEYIYIEGIRKDAVLDLKMEKETDYVPVTVRFDASKSYIKNDDIVKFEYDYGDGVVEIRDAINPGHKYTEAGDYTVKLTVTGKSGKKYSTEKSLILKPAPQETRIGVSLKRAPIGQGIDFSSEESAGRIIEYFWQFGDGSISSEANPTHKYTKAGNYTVKLRVDFENNNSLTDETEIEIYKE